MRREIRVLPKRTYQKIAAGEIIDAQSSVVRELLDNALDAEATEISIKVLHSEQHSISVQDNGHGMSKQDLLLCYKQHSTSKILEFEDLYTIHSMGFRGEALHAISTVSKLEISTQTRHEELGHTIRVEGGQCIDEREAIRQPGTSVTVSHLFYNIPARQKALKTQTYEWNKIKTLTLQKAFPFPETKISLYHNHKEVQTQITSRHKEHYINTLFGEHTYPNLIEAEQQFEDFHLHAYFSKPNYFKAQKRLQVFYINKRVIWAPALSNVLTRAYQEICPRGEYPAAILCITCPPQLLDINIHPTKQEVRFSKEQALYQAVYTLIKKSILKQHSVPDIQFGAPKSVQTFFREGHEAPPPTTLHTPQKSTPTLTDYTIRGLLFNTYILLEQSDRLILIDQHAAHERMIYEELQEKLKASERIPSEALLIPITLEFQGLSEEEAEKKLTHLTPLGFDIEHFGHSRYLIRGLPYYVELSKAEKLAERMLELLVQEQIPSKEELMRATLTMHACKSAIKSGDILNTEHITYLITEWLKHPFFFSCPHGRPTAITLQKHELERLFLRIK